MSDYNFPKAIDIIAQIQSEVDRHGDDLRLAILEESGIQIVSVDAAQAHTCNP